MSEIDWLCENVAMPQMDYACLERWLKKVAESHGRILHELVYVFCDDNRILEVNKQFLNHDYFTDIITFDYCRGKLLRGDIYISLDTVRSNSEDLQCSYDSELKRVIAHGLLHLCGINDKAPGEREIMEYHENEALALWNEMNKTKSDDII